jgi:hypothetical protein
MWPDNETDSDFLNFTGVADTVAEIIVQAQGRPISIGVSGAWGVGPINHVSASARFMSFSRGGPDDPEKNSRAPFSAACRWRMSERRERITAKRKKAKYD